MYFSYAIGGIAVITLESPLSVARQVISINDNHFHTLGFYKSHSITEIAYHFEFTSFIYRFNILDIFWSRLWIDLVSALHQPVQIVILFVPVIHSPTMSLRRQDTILNFNSTLQMNRVNILCKTNKVC